MDPEVAVYKRGVPVNWGHPVTMLSWVELAEMVLTEVLDVPRVSHGDSILAL